MKKNIQLLKYILFILIRRKPFANIEKEKDYNK